MIIPGPNRKSTNVERAQGGRVHPHTYRGSLAFSAAPAIQETDSAPFIPRALLKHPAKQPTPILIEIERRLILYSKQGKRVLTQLCISIIYTAFVIQCTGCIDHKDLSSLERKSTICSGLYFFPLYG